MKSTAHLRLFLACCLAAVGALGTLFPALAQQSGQVAPTSPPATWPDYSVNGPGFTMPTVSDGGLVAHGYELVTRTFALIGPEVDDATKRFAGNNLACKNCHLDAGTKRSGLPLVGVFRTYPRFSVRSGRTISLTERIDECMTRSMNGRALPPDSREMAAFVAYLRFIGIPEADVAPAAPPAAQPGAAARGQAVFDGICAACHQADGLGKRWGSAADGRGYVFPPLWGPDSFNDGAGMDRFDKAVGFVRHNMPRGIDPASPLLTLQEAWDVAALLQSKPRPKYQPR
jgi:thiosulfate dehydrogenase